MLGAAPDFAIEDLPQAGYRVYAKAPAMNSRISEVMLVKGSSEVYKILELRPASSLDGAIRDEEGAPAAEAAPAEGEAKPGGKEAKPGAKEAKPAGKEAGKGGKEGKGAKAKEE